MSMPIHTKRFYSVFIRFRVSDLFAIPLSCVFAIASDDPNTNKVKELATWSFEQYYFRPHSEYYID